MHSHFLPNCGELKQAIVSAAYDFLCKNDSSTLELECRLGKSSRSGFYSSIDRRDFESLFNVFREHFEHSRGYFIEETYDVILDGTRVTINASNGEVLEAIQKQNRRKKDFECGSRYTIRLSCASEFEVSHCSRPLINAAISLFSPVHPWAYMQQRGIMRIPDGYGVHNNLTTLLWIYVGEKSALPPQKATMVNYAGFCRDGTPAALGEYTIEVSPRVCQPLCPFSRFPSVPFQIARLKQRKTFTMAPGTTISFTIVTSTQHSVMDLHMPNAVTTYEVEYEVLPKRAIPHCYQLHGYDMHLVTLECDTTAHFLQSVTRYCPNLRIHVFRFVSKLPDAMQWGSVRGWLARNLEQDDIIVSLQGHFIFNEEIAAELYEDVSVHSVKIIGHIMALQHACTVKRIPRARDRKNGSFVDLRTMQTARVRKDPLLKTGKPIKVLKYNHRGMITYYDVMEGIEDDRVAKLDIADTFTDAVLNIASAFGVNIK